jgi:hypothetical protein
MLKVLAAVAAASLLAACGTITRGTTEQVTINSNPPGAEARTSLGQVCTATPCTYAIPRKSDFIVSYSMPGYQDLQVPVATRIAGGGAASFAGNILVGGVIGMGVDAATGSSFEHYPNPVMGELHPIETRPVAKRRHKRKVASAPVGS